MRKEPENLLNQLHLRIERGVGALKPFRGYGL